MKILVTVKDGVYAPELLEELPGRIEVEVNCLLDDAYSPAIKVEVVDG